MTKIIQQIFESYKLAAVFFLVAFPLACLPIVFEGLQHIAEVKIGMFAGEGGDNITDNGKAIRLFFGSLKVFSIIAVTVFIARFYVHGQSVRRALQFSASAKKAVMVGCLFMAAALVAVFYAGPALLRFITPDISETRATLIPLLVLFLAGFPLQSKMNGWMARIFDDAPLSEAQNKSLNKTMKGGFNVVIIAAFLPLMALHYFLNIQAMGGTAAQLWGLLTIDSVVVGLLACLLGSALYVVYRDGRK